MFSKQVLRVCVLLCGAIIQIRFFFSCQGKEELSLWLYVRPKVGPERCSLTIGSYASILYLPPLHIFLVAFQGAIKRIALLLLHDNYFPKQESQLPIVRPEYTPLLYRSDYDRST